MNQTALQGCSLAPLIWVVDDDASFRRAIQRLLRSFGYRVQDYASVGDMLLAGMNAECGCLILDIHMPGPSGLDLQDMLKTRAQSLPVIFVTGEATVHESVRAMKGGAADFLLKPIEGEALRSVVGKTLSDAAYRSEECKRLSSLQTRYASLSAREKQVLHLVVQGKLNKQISGTLDVAERTVKAHRARAMEKMEVRTLAELVRAVEQLHLPDSEFHAMTKRQTISHAEVV